MTNHDTDPLLERMLVAAPVTDEQLRNADVLSALEGLSTHVRPRPHYGRLVRKGVVAGSAVAAATLVIIGVGAGLSDDTRAPDDRGTERFERVAAEFPLPAGATYATLRSDSYDEQSDADLRATIALFSGCQWSSQLPDSKGEGIDGAGEAATAKAALRKAHDALTPAQQAMLAQAKLSAKEASSSKAETKQAWDRICQDMP